MQEYKREKVSLEAKLKDMSKAATRHNEHLRVIDTWYNQVCGSTVLIMAVSPTNSSKS